MSTTKKLNFLVAIVFIAMVASSCSVEYRRRHRHYPPPVEEKVIVRP